MAQINFEVYAFSGGRWTVQQTFPSGQREKATDFAQELYAQSHIQGVRVVQETYDPEGGETDEKTVLSRTKSDAVPKSLKKETGKAPEPARPSPPKKKAPAVVASKPVPGLPQAPEAAKPAAKAKPKKAKDKTWHRTRQGRTTGLTAASSAVIAGSALLLLQAPGEAPTLLPAALSVHSFFAVSIVLLGAGVAGAGFILLDTAGERGLLPGVFYDDLPLPAAAAAVPTPLFPRLEIEDDELPADAQAPPGGLPAEALRLIAYFHDALAALPREAPYMKDGKLDTFNWFGCHLFFAGLCDDEAARYAWPRSLTRQIIATAMTAALNDAKAAARFAQRYEDYLTEPRSLAMFGYGSDAARERATGNAAADALRQALAEWNQKVDATPVTGHVAVMFTDIVGSTDFTQTHGDAKHFEMVQAHDRIVRAALQEFSGREIKHTGDGIMAAFDDAGLGVRAAQRVQREIRAHREVSPDIGMGLRIGLAAGEPIKAGNDLFGSTVQLAARICAVANTDQVVITEPVREICAPLGLAFVDLGEQPLKGFKQPVRVHAVAEG